MLAAETQSREHTIYCMLMYISHLFFPISFVEDIDCMKKMQNILGERYDNF